MKILLLGDTHLGARKGSDIFDEYFERCFSEFIFPLLKEQKVYFINQLGDLFDDRKAVSTKSITESKRYFFDKLRDNDIRLYTLLGNHDIFYRESLSVASQREFLSAYENVTIIDAPHEHDYGDIKIGMMPWICEENKEESMNFLQNTRSNIIIGHFEISGFQMYKGVKAKDGLSPKVFERFHRVWSGHYHTRSNSDNISYLGTPYELTWQDCDDPRGVHIYDTDKDTLEFFENPIKLFRKIEYTDFISDDVSLYNKCFVKVYVLKKADQVKFEKYINSLYDAGAHEVIIIEDLSEFKETSIIDDGKEVDIEDTMDIVKRYINSIETDKDKDKIYQYMQTLYLDSINNQT